LENAKYCLESKTRMRKGIFSLTSIVMLFILASFSPMIELSGDGSELYAPGDNGGETEDVILDTPLDEVVLTVGDSVEISWHSTGDTVTLWYSTDGGENWILIVRNIPEQPNSYDWTVPDTPTTNGVIKVVNDDTDTSDTANDIRILSNEEDVTVTIGTPNGGEVWTVGEEVTIEWVTIDLDFESVDIFYALSSGPWITIAEDLSGTLIDIVWTVPDAPSDEVQIKICADDGDNQVCDISDEFFSIVESVPVITLSGETVLTLQASNTEEYTDAGATCYDEEDGDLSFAIEVEGQAVNMRVPGTYEINFHCTDSDGNTATPVTRTVIIEEVGYVPCSPIGWWNSTTSYDALQTVFYPPPTTIAWVSLIDDNTGVPAVSGNGHDSWVICDYRDVEDRDPVKLIWNDTLLVYDGDYEVAELTDNYTFNGTDVEVLIGMEGTLVAGKEIIFDDPCLPYAMPGWNSSTRPDICLPLGVAVFPAMSTGIWIDDGNGGLDLQIVQFGHDMTDSIHCIVGGTMCSMVEQGDGGPDRPTMADDGFDLLSLARVPPIVVSDCDDGALELVGVTIGSTSRSESVENVHVVLAFADSIISMVDIGGHLIVEATGIATSNDPIFFTHGAQCGAQATVVVELGEGVTAYDSFRNRLEHGPGLHDSIANYVDNGDGTMTVVYTYPGLTCGALINSEQSHISSGTEGRDVLGHLMIESSGIVTCEDAVVEVVTRCPPGGPGIRCVIVKDVAPMEDESQDVDVLLEVSGIDVTERDAVVAGAVGGTTFAMSAMYAHWRHKVAAARRAAGGAQGHNTTRSNRHT
jgi:hypothetical protein